MGVRNVKQGIYGECYRYIGGIIGYSAQGG